MSEFKLPTYEESCSARKRGEASALQMFISDNEPAGRGEEIWRELLADVIDEVLFYDRRERAARAALAEDTFKRIERSL